MIKGVELRNIAFSVNVQISSCRSEVAWPSAKGNRPNEYLQERAVVEMSPFKRTWLAGMLKAREHTEEWGCLNRNGLNVLALKVNRALQQIAPGFLSKTIKATEAAMSMLEPGATPKVLTSTVGETRFNGESVPFTWWLFETLLALRWRAFHAFTHTPQQS